LKKINIGLIGLGRIGRIHFHNCMRLKDARLAAVADTSKKARRFAKSHGIKAVYEDYRELLEDPTVDCAVIAAPTFLHSECATMAAENKKHIFLEKPLARNVKEGKEIVSKVQKASVKIMVGYPLRFSIFSKIKNELDQGHLGDVVNAFAINIWRGPFLSISNAQANIPLAVPDWWFNPELTGGGALIDLGCHMINLLLWYFGDDIVNVKSVLGHRYNMLFEDHAVCFIKFKQGISAIVNVGWYSLERLIKVDVFGTAKTASIVAGPAKASSHLLHTLGIKPLPEFASFYRELDYFVKCIINDQNPIPSAEDALKDLEVISLAYKNEIQRD